MHILVTGGNGQLAACLRKTAPAKLSVTYHERNTLDLTQREQTHAVIAEIKPDVIVNAAAYTKVDIAEKEKDAAFAANEAGVAHLAAAAKASGAYLIHISTDFLFHGAFNRPIDESAAVKPIGVYAESKAAGERALMASGTTGAIVRTAWLYSEFGANFMKTMLRLGKEKPQLNVIADQHGSPTYAVDLAHALWRMVLSDKKPGLELYHFANFGVTTWYDFATAILRTAGLVTPVNPILTHEYPVATPRPAYSALWPKKFSAAFDFPIRHWQAALQDAVAAWQSEGASS